MKKTFLILSVILFSLIGCQKNNSNSAQEFIEGVSPIGIERDSSIFVTFKKDLEKLPSNIESCFKLSPKYEGTWNVDDRTVSFVPAKPFKANSKINLSVDCSKLFNTENKGDIFSTVFFVASPKYDISFDEVRYNSYKDEYTVSGSVKTDIPVSKDLISKTVKANLSGNNQSVEWTQDENKTKWNFFINEIPSSESDKTLNIKWNGKYLASNLHNNILKGIKSICFPSSNKFSILDVNTSKPNTILVSFSKALDVTQDLSSFIRAYNLDNKLFNKFNISVKENVASLFSDNNFEGVKTVSLNSGIRSSDLIALADDTQITLSEKWDLPEVKFKNDNVILPTTQGSVVAIETKNLTGLLIQVYEIYNRNINQFLQTSELDEKYEIYRVGDPVWEKKVSFDWNDSMQNKFVSRGLDLSGLLKKYTSGMYHIRITFRKDQVKYVCRNSHSSFNDLDMPPNHIEPYKVPNQKSYWDYAEQRNTYGYWSYRDDPCHPAFYTPSYNSKCLISKNIIISNLGIIAKEDVNGKFYVTVTDMTNAKPLDGVSVKATNYTGTVLASGKTNAEGTCVLSNCENAFVITATSGNQTSYLKISGSMNLSSSHFDVGGEKSEKGVKGFIYGERGVWRPGDILYLTFVLQDLNKTIPKDMPLLFELTDPLGHITDTQTLTKNVDGFYPINTKTSADSVTGNWNAKVTLGGKSWNKLIKIETIVPNKLSVELTSEQKILKARNSRLTLKSSWLNGAPTPNYKAEVSLAYSVAPTAFASYDEYTFVSPEVSFSGSRDVIWNGKLDANSSATFSPNLKTNSMPGKMIANFVSKVFEENGGFSIQSNDMYYSPYDCYVGLKVPKGDKERNMLLTDVDHTVDVVVLDEEGKPYQTDKTLTYNVYKLEWKWWWEKDAYSSATYVNYYHKQSLANGRVNVSGGKGSFDFQIKYPEWGRYLIEVKDGDYGHKTAKIVYIDWPGWAGRAQENGAGSAAVVPLTSAKTSYEVGEEAQVSFNANSASRALVTIEKAGEVLSQHWVQAANGTNTFNFTVTQAMLPNVYVHVSLLQPHMQTANSLPIRMYGIVPINVTSKKTVLTPVISTPEIFEPNKNASITVSEANGKEMVYTLAVVDEGLLGITNYHSPNLRKEFYKKEASLLKNWDLYRYVMNAYSGKLETMLSIGGSEEILDLNNQDTNRFAPVVKFFGPFKLSAGEKRTTSFKMPQYIGAVRAMVIAGANGAYGTTEKLTRVKSSIMVQPSLPRTLGSNEKISVPVTVFNGEDKAQSATVDFEISGVIKNKFTKTVALKPNENKVLTFEVETTTPGIAFFKTSAKGDLGSSSSTTNVNVISKGIPVTYKTTFAVKKGKAETVSVPTPSEKNTTELAVELSPMPPIDLQTRLSYLIQYPHGCIEQITSKGFPQLFVPEFTKLSPEKLKEVRKNIESVIDRYSGYQTSSGGFAYWPGNSTPNEWGTCYAFHFMTEAKKAGYTVPNAMYDNALSFISNSAAYWNSSNNSDNSTQAYRLFVLALAGKSDMGAMNRLSNLQLEDNSTLFLSAAYALSGKKDVANKLLRKYKFSTSKYRNLAGDFGSSVRENAVYMYVCNLTGSADAIKYAKILADTLSADEYLNTQEVAWSLYALLPYYNKSEKEPMDYAITSNGVTKKNSAVANSVIEKLEPDFAADKQKVSVMNYGNGVLYGVLTSSGKSIPGKELKQAEGIELKAMGFNSLQNVKIGDTCNLTVTVKNISGSQKLENLAMTIPVSTCLEYSNERLVNDNYYNNNFTYQDIKDEAIYTYFDLKSGESKTFTFAFTVAYSGEFFIPAVSCEAMYDNSIVSVQPGFKVKIAQAASSK